MSKVPKNTNMIMNGFLYLGAMAFGAIEGVLAAIVFMVILGFALAHTGAGSAPDTGLALGGIEFILMLVGLIIGALLGLYRYRKRQRS